MQTKFTRHQKVRLLIAPNPEYTEFYSESEIPIKKGALGEINLVMQNGSYHVRIYDEKTKETIAYILIDEDSLESI